MPVKSLNIVTRVMGEGDTLAFKAEMTGSSLQK